jgi:hypothetical protein
MSARTGLDKVWASAGEAVADIASGSLVAVGCCPRVGCAAWSRRTSGRTRSSPVSTSRGARGGADAVRNAGRTAAVRWVRYPGFLHRDRVGIQVADGGPPWKYDADANVVMSSPEKETRSFNGRDYVLERTIVCDFGLVRAWKGDRHGNLVYRRSARNFSPLAAMSGRITIAEVEELVEPGSLDPDQVHNPGTCPLRSTRFCPCSAQYRPAARSSRSHPARCRRLSMPTLPVTEAPTGAHAHRLRPRVLRMAWRIRIRVSRQRAWADSPVKHLAQSGGERVRVAGLAVLPAEEAAVAAREPRRLNPEGIGDGHRGALCE